MKKICVVILFAFLMLFSYSPLANAEETVCRNIKDASTCASSTQNGGPCEWKAGEGENEGKCVRSFPDASSCADFTTEDACMTGRTSDNGSFGCNWNKQYEFCSVSGLAYLSCGSGDEIAYDIPVIVPRLVSYFIVVLKTATPVILIFISMIQLIKAIGSQNEDEMKKARSSIVKKLIAAVLIFFVISIVQFVVKQVADDSEQSSVEACMTCFINNDCAGASYFTDGYGNCYGASDGKVLDKCPVEHY